MNRIQELFFIIISLITLSFIGWILELDQNIASAVYSPDKGWEGAFETFWRWLYVVAPWPAIAMGVGALAVLIVGFLVRDLAVYRKEMVFLLLLLLLGPGLLVNIVLKDNVGRPRPHETIQFGGEHEYFHFWQGGTSKGRNNSFPSGHASIAFAVMGPWFLLRSRHGRAAKIFLASGISWGLLVGTARIFQGGHFISDVIWAGGLVYLVGGGLALYFSVD